MAALISLPEQTITPLFVTGYTEEFHVQHTRQWRVLFSAHVGAYSKLAGVQVLHSDDYNATRVQYITLISHTGAQWYHN